MSIYLSKAELLDTILGMGYRYSLAQFFAELIGN